MLYSLVRPILHVVGVQSLPVGRLEVEEGRGIWLSLSSSSAAAFVQHSSGMSHGSCCAAVTVVVVEYEIEKLMKQHEVDLDNLKETHKLEMEKLEAEHRYSLELANSNAQNEMTKQLMGSFVGNMMAAPQMQDLFASALADSIKKGQQE